MDDIGERMTIQNSMKVRSERHSASDLSQTSEEYLGARHIRVRRQVLRVTRVANDCVWNDAAQEKRRGRQTRGADHDVGLSGELLEVGGDFDLNSICFQLAGEPAQSFDISSAEQHALYHWTQTTRAAGTHISRCSNDEQR